LNIKDALHKAACLLEKKSIKTARLDAEVLLAYVLKCERYKLYVDFEKEITEKQASDFFSLIERRRLSYPVAYLVGKKEFMGIEFDVTEEVLIPRPDTEILVETAIDIMKEMGNEILAVDVGTGSGAIAVSIAYFLSNIQIIATDISEEALKIAEQNAKKHNVADKITFLKGSLLNPILENCINVDIIVANLPYIPSCDILNLSKEVRYEPKIALDGGEDGLAYYRELLPQAHAALQQSGYLLIEIGCGQGEKICSLAGVDWDKKIYKDLAGRERLVVLKKR